jgi:arginyl-tRNA synthetase
MEEVSDTALFCIWNTFYAAYQKTNKSISVMRREHNTHVSQSYQQVKAKGINYHKDYFIKKKVALAFTEEDRQFSRRKPTQSSLLA